SIETNTRSKSHGVDIRTIIPFSGVGHKLVETNTLGVPPKAQPSGSSPGLNKTLPHSPSGLSILNNKSSLPGQKNTVNTVGSAPRISVANTKVFINVNGSPIKLPAKRPPASQGESTPSRISDFFLPNQKTSSIAVPSTSTSFTSPGLHCMESTGQPAKRPRLEDKKTLDSFFIKTPRVNVTNGELVPKVPPAAATPATTTMASTSQQSIMVSCPVCRSKVLESNINQHLDMCLGAC
uniref:UBZ4-type domain-containing protein n=1 Tax=Leptobrachium leishanense TaxID=445787 RepID=A0A8C5MLT2_9ANUR